MFKNVKNAACRKKAYRVYIAENSALKKMFHFVEILLFDAFKTVRKIQRIAVAERIIVYLPRYVYYAHCAALNYHFGYVRCGFVHEHFEIYHGLAAESCDCARLFGFFAARRKLGFRLHFHVPVLAYLIYDALFEPLASYIALQSFQIVAAHLRIARDIVQKLFIFFCHNIFSLYKLHILLHSEQFKIRPGGIFCRSVYAFEFIKSVRIALFKAVNALGTG